MLTPGTRIGVYQITGPIGAGGMGVVYRARDTKLQRDVALKLLPDEFLYNIERRARFEREAQVLAALNHPHIAQIYGFEEQTTATGSTLALVMELVEGEDLAARIGRGAIPIDEAVSIARQVAEGLEAAHEQGVVHRDLKPANIKLRPDGTVKVLDFGLAKPAEAPAHSAALANSPTITSPAHLRVHGTEPGVILGTAGYMSPEQARGKHVDKRADIWSFGILVFEMLTGRRAFDGETVSDTIAAVLTKEVELEALPPDTPLTIQGLLRRCLERAPSERLRDIGEARIVLSQPEATSRAPRTGGDADHLVAGSPRRRWLEVAAAGAVVAVAILTGMLFIRQRGPAAAADVIRFNFKQTQAGTYFRVAVSPDGRRIATVTLTPENGTRITTRSLGSTAIDAVPGSEDSNYPFWSPDGKFLCFFVEGQLRKVDLAGGRPETLAAATQPVGGTWHKDGVILFATGSGFYRLNAEGGAATKIDLVDGAGARSLRGFPQLLPDGDHFLYFIGGPSEEGAVWLGSLAAPASRFLFKADSFAQYANPGYLMFARGNTLMAHRFDREKLTTEGEAISIGQVMTSWTSPELVRGEAGFSVAEGVLAFVPIPPQSSRHVWYQRNGKEDGAIANPPAGAFQNPSLSPNGRWLAWQRIDLQSGNWDIWLHDVARNVATRLTSDPAQDSDPVWSPDGERIAFFSTRNKTFGLYTKRADSSQSEELVQEFDGQILPTSWSADGQYIVYTKGDISQLTQIWALPLTGDRRPVQITQASSFTQYGAQVSPDSRWIAYASDDTGGMELYVQRFPAGGRKIQLTHGGGFHPRWRGDGKELFYWGLSPDRVLAIDLRYGADGISAGRPKVAVDARLDGLSDSRTHYTVTADGQRFLLRQDPAAARDLTVEVIVNWPAALMSSSSTSRLTAAEARR